MFKSHKGPVSELHIVDQYMMEVQFISAQRAVARYSGAAPGPTRLAVVRLWSAEGSGISEFPQYLSRENVITLA